MSSEYMTLPELVAELAGEVSAIEVKVGIVASDAVATGIAAAKSLVPVGATGRLRDSIKPGLPRGGKGKYGYHAGGGKVDYAPFVEFGTSDTPPAPFMGPSADRAEEVFLQGLYLTIGPGVSFLKARVVRPVAP